MIEYVSIYMEIYKLKIVMILTVGFILASILGYLTQRIKLSPLLGYLIGGYLIGPFSPGFVADIEVSEQLAEIGVILMMFGVGLHFKWEELSSVKNIAITGAIGQTLITVLVTTWIVHLIGWEIDDGLVMGISIGVASTVVLVRVLSDNNLLNTNQGHIAVGWLIVEDVFTVIALIFLPLLVEPANGAAFSSMELISTFFTIMVKIGLLGVIIFTLGKKVISTILSCIARTRSHELFTLTVLALTFTIATGSSLFFGTSIALGAFIAGMVIGRTESRHQALANSLSLKDVFVVIFFLSIGMLFNPDIIRTHTLIFFIMLALVVLLKPLVAYLIVILMRYPLKTALTVAISLGQIGEFSFILAEESSRMKILPDEGYDIIVACALVSIAINPLLFQSVNFLAGLFEDKEIRQLPQSYKGSLSDSRPRAIVIGYGPTGQGVVRTLEKLGYTSIIIDRNIDTIENLNSEYQKAIFGDADSLEILQAAQVNAANLLILTIPDCNLSIKIIDVARQLNPEILILARATYKSDEQFFKNLSVAFVSTEEETIKAFSHAVYRLTDSFSRGYHFP